MNSTSVQHAHLLEALNRDSRSDAEIARNSGVSQPTVWRLRRGVGARLRSSRQFNKLCEFYGVNELTTSASPVSLEGELKGAIMAVWDGSDNHARALIKVIHSLKGLGNHSQPEHLGREKR